MCLIVHMIWYAKVNLLWSDKLLDQHSCRVGTRNSADIDQINTQYPRRCNCLYLILIALTQIHKLYRNSSEWWIAKVPYVAHISIVRKVWQRTTKHCIPLGHSYSEMIICTLLLEKGRGIISTQPLNYPISLFFVNFLRI